MSAIDWLREHTDWRDTIFSAEGTGNTIVGRIGHRVFLGHIIETAYYDRKAAAVATFFGRTTTDETRVALLRSCDCRYVFYGPLEQTLGDWNPSTGTYLKPVFRLADVVVFRVLP